MATLTVDTVDLDGVQPTGAAASAGGDEFVNRKNTLLLIENADASSHTVTVNSQENCDQGFDHDISIVVPAGESRVAGPFDPARFNDAAGKVQLTYDAVTSLTVSALKI